MTLKARNKSQWKLLSEPETKQISPVFRDVRVSSAVGLTIAISTPRPQAGLPQGVAHTIYLSTPSCSPISMILNVQQKNFLIYTFQKTENSFLFPVSGFQFLVFCFLFSGFWFLVSVFRFPVSHFLFSDFNFPFFGFLFLKNRKQEMGFQKLYIRKFFLSHFHYRRDKRTQRLCLDKLCRRLPRATQPVVLEQKSLQSGLRQKRQARPKNTGEICIISGFESHFH